MKNPTGLLLAVAFLPGGSLFAQSESLTATQTPFQPRTNPTAAGTIRPIIWEANLEGTAAFIQLKDVESVLLHEYVVDAVLEVREVTVTLDSNILIRFYHAERVGLTGAAGQRISQAAASFEKAFNERLAGTVGAPELLPDQPGGDKEKAIVHKHYPVTTHAHMIEYRLKEKEQINALYVSLRDAVFIYRTLPLVPEQRPEAVATFDLSDDPDANPSGVGSVGSSGAPSPAPSTREVLLTPQQP